MEKQPPAERDALPNDTRIMLRILGLFLTFYGFLTLSQPEQYGLGLPSQYSPILGLGFIIVGIYLILKKPSGG